MSRQAMLLSVLLVLGVVVTAHAVPLTAAKSKFVALAKSDESVSHLDIATGTVTPFGPSLAALGFEVMEGIASLDTTRSLWYILALDAHPSKAKPDGTYTVVSVDTQSGNVTAQLPLPQLYQPPPPSVVGLGVYISYDANDDRIAVVGHAQKGANHTLILLEINAETSMVVENPVSLPLSLGDMGTGSSVMFPQQDVFWSMYADATTGATEWFGFDIKSGKPLSKHTTVPDALYGGEFHFDSKTGKAFGVGLEQTAKGNLERIFLSFDVDGVTTKLAPLTDYFMCANGLSSFDHATRRYTVVLQKGVPSADTTVLNGDTGRCSRSLDSATGIQTLRGGCSSSDAQSNIDAPYQYVSIDVDTHKIVSTSTACDSSLATCPWSFVAL